MKTTCILLALCMAAALHAQTASSVVVIKDGNSFRYGEQQMNRAAYKQFLQDECPQAYQQYMHGERQMIAGWSLFGGGLACASLAFPAFVGSAWSSDSPEAAHRGSGMGAAFFTAGLVSATAVIVSIPLLSVGYTNMDKSVKTYNAQCTHPATELSVGLTGEGISLAVRF